MDQHIKSNIWRAHGFILIGSDSRRAFCKLQNCSGCLEYVDRRCVMTYLSEETRWSLYLGFDTELLESSPARRKMHSHPNYCISGHRYTLCRLPITTLNRGYTLTEPLKCLLLLPTAYSLLQTTPSQSCSLQANHTGTSRYGASESWAWALDYVVLFSCCQSWTKMQEAHWNTLLLYAWFQF